MRLPLVSQFSIANSFSLVLVLHDAFYGFLIS